MNIQDAINYIENEFNIYGKANELTENINSQAEDFEGDIEDFRVEIEKDDEVIEALEYLVDNEIVSLLGNKVYYNNGKDFIPFYNKLYKEFNAIDLRNIIVALKNK